MRKNIQTQLETQDGYIVTNIDPNAYIITAPEMVRKNGQTVFGQKSGVDTVMEYLKSAWRSLFRKKFRTILTLISIAIGVASVVLISMIGDTGKGAINEEINALGLGNLSVSAVQKSAVTLDETDLERVQQRIL